MPQDIPTRTLLVISDTPVQKTGGQHFAFEPVLREMEMLTPLFDKIIWLGCKAGMAEVIMKKCEDDKIQIIQMPSVSHSSYNWLRNLLNYPIYISNILKYRKNIKYIHTRGPSHPAIISLLLSSFDAKRQYWHKYAGSWNNKELPLTYRLQQSILRQISNSTIKTTINGDWNEANANILSFENPCISESELQTARAIADLKDFSGSLCLLFVGNLNTNKGVINLLHALRNATPGVIKNVFIIGDGPARSNVEELARQIHHVQILMLGALGRDELNEYYKKSHLLVLPSISEGFPKVIAEASAYGCIPIVTAVSAIPQYIKHMLNGYLLMDNTPLSINTALDELTSCDKLKELSKNAADIAGAFTYERYVSRVKNEIFNL